MKILHVGYPKTGTTSLQLFLQKNDKEYRFFKKPKKKIPCSEFIIVSDEDISVGLSYDNFGRIKAINRINFLKKLQFVPDLIIICNRNTRELKSSWYKYQYHRGRIYKSNSIDFYNTWELTKYFEKNLDLNYFKQELKVLFPKSKIKIFSYNSNINEEIIEYLRDKYSLVLDNSKITVENKRKQYYRNGKWHKFISKFFGLRAANFFRDRFAEKVELR